MVAVVEQADVPARTHAREEAQQRARAFGKLEAIEPFVAHATGVPTDHVAHVELSQFVVAEIDHRVSPAGAGWR